MKIMKSYIDTANLEQMKEPFMKGGIKAVKLLDSEGIKTN